MAGAPAAGDDAGVLKFACYGKKNRPDQLDLDSAYALGPDGVPVRAELTVDDGMIRCTPRSNDPVALAILWTVADFGTVLLETTRLPPRERPYVLNVEMARHRLMRISLKREEWGLFDYPGVDELAAQVDSALKLFVEALQHQDDPKAAAKLADKSLAIGLAASERLCHFHASVFLSRRQQSGGFSKPFLGVSTPHKAPSQTMLRAVKETFDFCRVPFIWREIEPKEQVVGYSYADAWIAGCKAAKLPMRGGPLLNFGVRFVPDWMYIWENDYDTIQDYARQHIARTVKRYASQITSWDIATGLNAGNVFDFTVEQIMDLTRMAASVAKQIAPHSSIILEITQPWGEYFARKQRTIPPLLYADMAVQSGISFDAFGLQFLVGSGGDHVHDMFQVSSLIDRLANLGKPIHITALACPSADNGESGQWYEPWSEEIQARWLTETIQIALSKPYVESICLRDLADSPDATIATGGILHADLKPKAAQKRLLELRRGLSTKSGGK